MFIEAQRNFVARIIDSLPVGLYVIDRAYRIRAWNRKREAGTQGVSREDALGREWQMATIQLDYQLPQRFDLEYRAADGGFERDHLLLADVLPENPRKGAVRARVRIRLEENALGRRRGFVRAEAHPLDRDLAA